MEYIPVSRIILGTGDTVVNKRDPDFHGACSNYYGICKFELHHPHQLRPCLVSLPQLKGELDKVMIFYLWAWILFKPDQPLEPRNFYLNFCNYWHYANTTFPSHQTPNWFSKLVQIRSELAPSPWTIWLGLLVLSLLQVGPYTPEFPFSCHCLPRSQDACCPGYDIDSQNCF